MILRFRVDFDQGFQVFRIAVEITPRQLVEPLPLCLAHQSGVQGDNPASCLIPCLDGLTLILVEEGCHFGAVVQNQNLAQGLGPPIKNPWVLRHRLERTDPAVKEHQEHGEAPAGLQNWRLDQR